MPEEQFTIIDNGQPATATAMVTGDRVFLPPAALKTALGWELRDEGLCQGPVCVPVPAASPVVTDSGVDLMELANLLERPLAMDPAERAAYVGTSAGQRAAALVSLTAPDFTLPDLTGRLHSLSDYRGQKVFLVAYASW
jgi:hypothetical protein